MSKEEILSAFYGTIIFRRGEQGWMTPFDPEQFKGKLTSDLIDAAHRRGRAGGGRAADAARSRAGCARTG